MDIIIATGQYEEAMMWCQSQFSAIKGSTDLLLMSNLVVYHNNAPYHSKRNLRLMCEAMYGKLTKAQHEGLFQDHVEAGIAISAQNATTYTCPLYASLLSLALTSRDSLASQHILCMSYGSGCAASMYGLEASATPLHTSDVLASLCSRR